MVKKKYNLFGQHKRGYTLLFASILGALMMAVGIAIFNISIKEVILSSSVRDSQVAFYAADTGIECALFWDIKGTDIFATSSSPTPTTSAPCLNNPNVSAFFSFDSVANIAKTTFDLNFLPQYPYCVTVTVTKINATSKTKIESRGHNTCDTDNLRRVERAIRVQY